MRFYTVAILAISTLSFIAESAPFSPKEGSLQRSRRRAVDYPVSTDYSERRLNQRRKRALNYSVVQVDGSSPTPNPPAPAPPQTVIHTVTQPAVTSTETMLYTTVIEQSERPKTVVLTTTKIHEVQLKPTAPVEPPNIVYVSAQPVVIAAPVTTVIKTVAAPTSTTKYYDNGLWHTSYPVKTWWWSDTPTPTPWTYDQGTGIYRRGSPRPVARRVQGKRARTPQSGEPERNSHATATKSRARKLSIIQQQAPWNVTRTELDGLRKFMD